MLRSLLSHPVMRSILILFLFGVVCHAALAQAGLSRGRLTGIVRDPAGTPVPNARIELSSSMNATTRSGFTRRDGSFAFEDLQSGTYTVQVTASHFSPSRNNALVIAVGRTTDFDAVLHPAGETQQVTVLATIGIIDTAQTSPVTNIDRDRIEELPIPSRRYFDFTLLSPGVSKANPALTLSSPGVSSSGFSAGGLRPSSNELSIDGVENNDEYTGFSRTELSPEAISDFQVVNHGYAAQFGGAAGGSVHVETRSGAAVQHGDAFVFVQNGALNAVPPLEPVPYRPDESRLRVGVSTGGEWRPARMFYYVAGEQESSHGEEVSDLSAQLAAEIDSALAHSGPLKDFRIQQGFFPTTEQETELSGRFDNSFGKNGLMIRYSMANNRAVNNGFHLQDIADASSRGSSFYSDNGLSGSWRYAPSARWFNLLSLEIAQRRAELKTAEAIAPGVIVAGVAEFGSPFAGNSRRYETHVYMGEGFMYQRNKHLLQAGFSANHVSLRSDLRDGFAGLYVFQDLPTLSSGRPDLFVQSFGRSDTNFGELRGSFWAQDHWIPSRSLTLDFGLRFDFNHLPDPLPQDWLNASPRVGFAWSQAGRWVVRGGFGTFYDRFLLSTVNRIEQFDGNQAQQLTEEGGSATLLWQAGQRFITPSLGTAPSIWRPAPLLKNPYAETASLGIERGLGNRWTASAEYRFVHGAHLGRTVNENLPRPEILTLANAASLGVDSPTPQQLGRPVFGTQRLNPSYDAINQFQTEAASRYNGLTLTVNRQFTEDLELMTGYTYSKSDDDASSDMEQPQNPYAMRDEWARSLSDQRHRVVLSGLWLLGDDPEDRGKAGQTSKGEGLFGILEGLEFAPILTVGSGMPQSASTGVDSGREHIYPFPARPLGSLRNGLTTTSAVNFDLRVLKMVTVGRGRLDLVAESFNVLNHVNVELLNPVFGSSRLAGPQFMHPLQAGDARRIQFSLDYEY